MYISIFTKMDVHILYIYICVYISKYKCIYIYRYIVWSSSSSMKPSSQLPIYQVTRPLFVYMFHIMYNMTICLYVSPKLLYICFAFPVFFFGFLQVRVGQERLQPFLRVNVAGASWMRSPWCSTSKKRLKKKRLSSAPLFWKWWSIDI